MTICVQLWRIHNAEQMILDHEEENPDKYKDKKFEETVDLSFDEENSVEYTQAKYKDSMLPKVILVMGLLYCFKLFMFSETSVSLIIPTTVAFVHQ